MADRWLDLRLGDAARKIGSGATPKGGKEAYLDQGPFALIRSQNVYSDQFSFPGLAYITDEQARALSNVAVEPGDVLLNITGDSVARCAQVDPSVLPARVNQHVAIVRTDPSRLDARFLRYYLISPPVQQYLHQLASAGATRPALTKAMLESLSVFAPASVDEQRAIASILGALDDKIELNRKMSSTLEAIARVLFKSWFVDFDPVRAKAEGRDAGLPAEITALFPDSFEDTAHGQIPSGWLTKSIVDVATASRATINPRKFSEEYFEHYSIPAYDAGRGAVVERGEAIKSNKFLVLQDAVLLSRLNPRTPRTWMPTSIGSRRAICSTEFAVMLPKIYSREWLYCLFSNQTFCDRLTTMVTGTSGSHQRVRPESLLAMPTVAPTEQVVQIFTKIVGPLLTRVALARNESLTLAALRNALLPKLISGEVRVTDAERARAASA